MGHLKKSVWDSEYFMQIYSNKDMGNVVCYQRVV